MRAARTPPEPAPMTKRSRSIGGQMSDLVAALLHLDAEFADDLLRQAVRPDLRILHALVENDRLLADQLAPERRLVEGERVFELLLGEAAGVDPRCIVEELGAAGHVFHAQLGSDIAQVLTQHRIGPQQDDARLLDHADDDRLVDRGGALDRDELLGDQDRCRRGLLRNGAAGGENESKRDEGGGDLAGGFVGRHEDPPVQAILEQEAAAPHGRSTMRTPAAPAITATWASPMNRPCSTTPVTRSR